MAKRTFTGFWANEVEEVESKGYPEIYTARDANFHAGFTTMRLMDLHEGVEGADMLMHENLQALLPHVGELEKGKRVDVHFEWELTEDRRDYERVKVLKVEVVDREV